MSKYRNTSKITRLIIHCAATPNGKLFCAHDIDSWHAQRGFKRNCAFISPDKPRLQHVGYHFVIGINGGIDECRSLTETGAHAAGHNTTSIGTCLIGTDKFTEQQWLSLKQHVQAIVNKFPDIKIIGHNEINPHKICPGFDVQKWLKGNMEPPSKHLLT